MMLAIDTPTLACDVCGCACTPTAIEPGEMPRPDDVIRTALWRAACGFALTYRDRSVMDGLLRAADARVPRSQNVQLDLFAQAGAA